jgi:hypothetical protein
VGDGSARGVSGVRAPRIEHPRSRRGRGDAGFMGKGGIF